MDKVRTLLWFLWIDSGQFKPLSFGFISLANMISPVPAK